MVPQSRTLSCCLRALRAPPVVPPFMPTDMSLVLMTGEAVPSGLGDPVICNMSPEKIL